MQRRAVLAASLAQREEEKLKDKMLRRGSAQADSTLPIISFLIAKLGAYTIFGFLLGWFGSIFQLSLTANTILQLAVWKF